ncbi:hypothetical protein BaRGS_00040383, partial [Batillaria attramentaria]
MLQPQKIQGRDTDDTLDWRDTKLSLQSHTHFTLTSRVVLFTSVTPQRTQYRDTDDTL